VTFDEQVFDFAAGAVKEVTCICNTTEGDDIIGDDMRMLADDDKNKDEYAKGSKAKPPVDARNSDNHNGDVKGQCYALLRMRPLSISCAESCVVIFCGKIDYDKSG
jgi:hypothetical protein